jgi:hypothetical protein
MLLFNVTVSVTVDFNRTGYKIIQNMLRNLEQMFGVIINVTAPADSDITHNCSSDH